jgi:hypothetical protein
MKVVDPPIRKSKESSHAITFLDCFWSLAEDDPSVRARAGQDLLIHCFSPNGTTLNVKDTSYSLRRLLDGLSSPRSSARQGFASCLTLFLQISHLHEKNDTLAFILQDLPEVAATFTSVHQSLRLMLLKSTTISVAADNNCSYQIKGKPSEERDCALGRLVGISAILRSGILKDAPISVNIMISLLFCFMILILKIFKFLIKSFLFRHVRLWRHI